MQDFKEIVSENFIYIDKTRYLSELINRGKFYFISRPRRFGKTLTCSTLSYLFKDTWIYDKWDFTPHPVISISMTEIDSRSPETVEASLKLHALFYRLRNLKPRRRGTVAAHNVCAEADADLRKGRGRARLTIKIASSILIA
jgi:hypothetical protein